MGKGTTTARYCRSPVPTVPFDQALAQISRSGFSRPFIRTETYAPPFSRRCTSRYSASLPAKWWKSDALVSPIRAATADMLGRLDSLKEEAGTGKVKWPTDKPSWTGAGGDVAAAARALRISERGLALRLSEGS